MLAQPKPLDWEWILRHALWSPQAADCAKVDVVDMVLCEGGTPTHYLFTAANGSVAARPGRVSLADGVREDFERLALGALGVAVAAGGGGGGGVQLEELAGPDAPVCLVHKQGGDVLGLSLDKFHALCKNGPTAEMVAVQACVVRGGSGALNEDGTENFAGLRHEYSLNAVGGATHHSYRLGVASGTTGASRLPRAAEVPCHDKVATDAMGRNAQALVSRYEARRMRCCAFCPFFVVFGLLPLFSRARGCE